MYIWRKKIHILRNIRCNQGWPLTATSLDETDIRNICTYVILFQRNYVVKWRLKPKKKWPLTAVQNYNRVVSSIQRVAVHSRHRLQHWNWHHRRMVVNGYTFGRETHFHLNRFPELQLLCRSCSLCLCAHVAAWNLYQHLHLPCYAFLLLAYVVSAALGKRMSEDITKSMALRD